MDVEYAVNCVKQGVSEIGKQFSELDIAAYISFSVHGNFKKATKAAVPVVAFIVAGSPSRVLERHGINPRKAEEIREALKANEWGRAFGVFSQGMIEAFSVCGTPDTCIQRFDQLLKLGISQFVVGSPIGPNVREALNLPGEKIIPNFGTRF